MRFRLRLPRGSRVRIQILQDGTVEVTVQPPGLNPATYYSPEQPSPLLRKHFQSIP